MATVTLRPNGTITAPGWGLVGCATLHAGTSDDSDSSYGGGSAPAWLDVGTFTLPATSRTKQARVRTRARCDPAYGGGAQEGVVCYIDPSPMSGQISASQLLARVPITFTNCTGPWVNVSWDQATINILAVTVAASNYWGDNNTPNIAEMYLDVLYAGAPSATAISPSGTLTDTTQPTATWSYAQGEDGSAQSAYQVKMFTSAVYSASGFNPETSTAAWDSGVVASSATSALSGVLPNNTTYRFYVKVAQNTNGNHWSAWSYVGFDIDAATADVSTVVATAQSASGRIQVAVTWDNTSHAWETLELERSDDAGTTWSFVRGVAFESSPASAYVTYDYEATPGVEMLYRARASYVLNTQTITGDWVQSSGATWTTTTVDWLKDLAHPSLSLAVTIQVLPTEQRGRAQGIMRPIGRTNPVVISDVLQAPAGQFVLWADTDQKNADLLALLADTDVFLLQMRVSDAFGSRYIAIGSVQPARRINLTGAPYRAWQCHYVEVDRPADCVVV